MTSPKARERLLIVSNRLPLTARRVSGRWRSERSSGGLIAAMAPLMRELDGLWFGWSGESRNRRRARPRLAHPRVGGEAPLRRGRDSGTHLARVLRGLRQRHALAAVPRPRLARHLRPRLLARLSRRERALRCGCGGAAEARRPHLGPGLPAAARAAAHPRGAAGRPHRVLPPHPVPRERGLPGPAAARGDPPRACSAPTRSRSRRTDTCTTSAARCSRCSGSRAEWTASSRRAAACAWRRLPIGIATEEWVALSQQRDVRRRIDELRARHAGRQLIVSVDRLDYTKGIPERLKTFRRLLRGLTGVAQQGHAHPGRRAVARARAGLRGAASRGGRARRRGQRRCRARRSGSRSSTSAARSRDGAGGALRRGRRLLGGTAARRDEPRREGVRREPARARRDPRALASSPERPRSSERRSASIPTTRRARRRSSPARSRCRPTGRRERMNAMFDRIRRDDAVAWSERFLSSLRAITAEDRRDAATERPEPDPAGWSPRSRERPSGSSSSTTTAPSCRSRSGLRTPCRTERLVDLLRRLTASSGTTVAILSGRPRSDIDRWFGDIARLWVAAEHGALLRAPGEDWQPREAAPTPSGRGVSGRFSSSSHEARPGPSSRRRSSRSAGTIVWPTRSSAPGSRERARQHP